MKNKTLAALLLLTIVLQSCHKDKDGPSSEVSMKNISGTYKLTALTNTVGNVTVDEFARMDACEKDDLTKLMIDGSWEIVDSGTMCSPSSADHGFWIVISTTKLSIDGDEADIISFNGTELKLQSVNISGGATHTSTVTYVKQ